MQIFRMLISLVTVLVIGSTSVFAETMTDDNSAFFHGAKRNYIFPPPAEWKLLIEEPGLDGYSFAFVPKDKKYDSTEIMITVTIYTLNDNTFASVVESDTTSLREHFGKSLHMNKRASLGGTKVTGLSCYAVTDSSQYVPTAMLGYFDGEQEIIIFELTTEAGFDRIKAETIFSNCLIQFKTLVHKELGVKSDK